MNRADEHPGDGAGGPPATHPFAFLVTERGGEVVGSIDDLAGAQLAGGRPAAVSVRDDCLLPAIAQLNPAQLASHRAPAGTQVYLLKAGWVAGPEGSPGARPVEPSLLAAVLDADGAGEVQWEEDPDFGYLVAAGVPGIGYPDDGLLLPRLLYARSGRVYEHAALVAEARRGHELLSRLAA